MTFTPEVIVAILFTAVVGAVFQTANHYYRQRRRQQETIAAVTSLLHAGFEVYIETLEGYGNEESHRNLELARMNGYTVLWHGKPVGRQLILNTDTGSKNYKPFNWTDTNDPPTRRINAKRNDEEKK